MKTLNPKPFNEVLSLLKVLYEQKISSNVKVKVGQLQLDGDRSQFLAIAIINETYDWGILLKLSTLRKIFKYLTKLNLKTARRLTDIEKLRL